MWSDSLTVASTNEDVTSLENRMYIMAAVEIIVLIFFAMFQVYYTRRLILKRRIV